MAGFAHPVASVGIGLRTDRGGRPVERVIVALIGVVWWALSASSAQRLPGQQISGLDPRDQSQVLLSQARSLQATDPTTAAALYAQVLERDPDE